MVHGVGIMISDILNLTVNQLDAALTILLTLFFHNIILLNGVDSEKIVRVVIDILNRLIQVQGILLRRQFPFKRLVILVFWEDLGTTRILLDLNRLHHLSVLLFFLLKRILDLLDLLDMRLLTPLLVSHFQYCVPAVHFCHGTHSVYALISGILRTSW